MSWRDSASQAWMACGWALAAAVSTGCYEQRICGEEETCDFADNDCDQRVDEDFVEDGIYASEEHCGGCGVRCADVFPTAEETECAVDREAGTASCRIVRCPSRTHRGDDGACLEDAPVACLPCQDDDDCAAGAEGTRCIAVDADDRRCLIPCEDECPTGFSCTEIDGARLCAPANGVCACSDETLGAEFGCLVESDEGRICAGQQLCSDDGLSACAAALDEVCNEEDDDCDGRVDENFRDDEGRYVDPLHCGRCGEACPQPGPNTVAECVPSAGEPRCEVSCVDGFVDVDGIGANGCECEIFDGEGPPPAIGGDADCDGVVDDSDEFIHVTTSGNDRNPGTLVAPLRTIQAGIERGRATGRDVLVARGVYTGGLDVVGGVSVFGGYRPDFRDRDLTLFPVMIEQRNAAPGAPVVTCRGITEPTRIEGFSIQATDAAAPGEGSTALFVDECTETVVFDSFEVIAGRGADGVRGRDSSENLPDLGFSRLADLDGVPGGRGNRGTTGTVCFNIPPGAGGAKSCALANVSGGNGGPGACPNLGCTNGRPCGNAGCTDFTFGGVCDLDAALRVAVSNPAPERGRGGAGGAAGEVTYNAPTNRIICNFCDDNPSLPRDGGDGSDGAPGQNGRGGLGCEAAPLVDLGAGRVRGGPGGSGTSGQNGSGGGGGSAGAGFARIGGTTGTCNDRAGGSGGGGGSGGCGAPQADGGTGGGASIGILIALDRSSGSTGPTFGNVRVVTASGGSGGDGGVGASGGAPGNGASGGEGQFFCARTGGRGGDGGAGGSGGGGGGGCGGGSHGVLLQGVASEAYRAALAETITVETVGVAGQGGRGGFSPGNSGAAGTDGSQAEISSEP